MKTGILQMLRRPFNENILNEDPPLGDPAKQIRFMAKALAWGAVHNQWSPTFYVRPRYHYVQDGAGGSTPTDYLGQEWIAGGSPIFKHNLQTYLGVKWQNALPQIELLETFGYLEKRAAVKIAPSVEMFNESPEYSLTAKALSLLDEPRYKSVFISYKRSESSAFALLLYDKLIGSGYDPFIDKRGIVPGEDWKKRLMHEIQICDVFVCLIGRETLKSENVLDDLDSALSRRQQVNDFPIIPIWHNNFEE